MKARVLLAAAVLLALVVLQPAYAGKPVPFDGPAVGGLNIAAPLPTGLLPLGIDLSSFGVANSELATVGPQSSASSASSAMLIVDDNHADCPNAQFTSIQAAVTAASPGAKIKVCPGTYVEQVTIPAGKDGLTLFSEGDLQAVIKAPPVIVPSPSRSIVLIQAHDVTLRHFTITGPGGGPCDSLEYGVRIDSGGSALVTDNHITQIRDEPFSGCQNGVAVLVGRNLNNTTGFGTIVHNTIDNYQKGGIVVDGQLTGPSSNAEVAYNDISGIGPTAVIAQNGIQVSRGAIANVHHNLVHDNIYSPATVTGEGILIFQVDSSAIQVHHNDVYRNSDGIGLYTTQNIEVGWNKSHDNDPYDGLFADTDTANNTIEHNKLTNNTEFDCDDVSVGPYNGLAAVANPWIQDLGNTENRPGLCKHATP
jgi:parallel beta helix pectate lyase-like protein